MEPWHKSGSQYLTVGTSHTVFIASGGRGCRGDTFTDARLACCRLMTSFVGYLDYYLFAVGVEVSEMLCVSGSSVGAMSEAAVWAVKANH